MFVLHRTADIAFSVFEINQNTHAVNVKRLHDDLTAVGFDGRHSLRYIVDAKRSFERVRPLTSHEFAAFLQSTLNPVANIFYLVEVRWTPGCKVQAKRLLIKLLGSLNIVLAKWRKYTGITVSYGC